MSPETISPVFPDRLIHPLPKRRLRERLSPNVADSIQYPPAHVSGTPLFYYPYNLKDDAPPASERANILHRGRAPATPPAAPLRHDSTFTTPSHRDREGSDAMSTSRIVRLVNRTTRPQPALIPSPPESHQTAPSAASSVDGYDSFENTNNKKKRKIPAAGDPSHAGSYTSTDLHAVASGQSSATAHDEAFSGSPSSTIYASPASFAAASPGISGPGRGRYGRARNGRSPLRPFTDAGSNWTSRHEAEPDEIPTFKGNAGIISSAIANAEKQATHEQESSGRAPEPPSVASTPASAQFTFTCTSQVPGNLTWPGSDPKMPSGSSQWSQMRLRGGQGQGASGVSRDSSDNTDTSTDSPRASETKDRKQTEKAAAQKLSKELRQQARDRKRRQRAMNKHAGYNPASDYMCPFCEYTAIYGEPPKSFIRSFELKERKKREQAEERQRLLDKAKARGRKSKKVPKAAAAAKTGSAADGRPDGERAGDGHPDDSRYGDGSYDDDDDGAGEDDLHSPAIGTAPIPNLVSGGDIGRAAVDSLAGHSPGTYHFPLVS